MLIGNVYSLGAASHTNGAMQPAASSVQEEAAPAGMNAQTVREPGPKAQAQAYEQAYARVMNDKFGEDCQTCRNRRYQDGSNDMSVSFQTPQHIDPSVSASVVMGHEQEHVTHEQANAKKEGGEVVSQNVVLHGANCPECGRYYIAGGTTTTVTRSGGKSNEAQNNGHGHGSAGQGMNLSV